MVAELPPAVVCRNCGCPRLISLKLRRTLRGTIRYRQCPDCGWMWRTREEIEIRVHRKANPVMARLDKAADVALGFLKWSDEDGIAAGELFDRVRRRVTDITESGFAFRMESDPRVELGDDGRYRAVSTPDS